MPIVSGLSTVYGLSGIPNSLLERIEIVKGPLPLSMEVKLWRINYHYKKIQKMRPFFADAATGWGEVNVDIGFKANGNAAAVLTGINYFNYSNPLTTTNNFTDLTLQDQFRFSKMEFQQKGQQITLSRGVIL
jgi:outer membrane receptor for ferrienterochelin and colicins